MRYKVLGVAVTALLVHGCATNTMQTATAPISAAAASRVVDGKTTRFDLIALFGQPNGYSMNMGYMGSVPLQTSQQLNRLMKQQVGDEGDSHIMHYKSCVLTSKASANIILPIVKGSRVETCKVFTALLDDNDVVVAHVYLDNDWVTQERIDKIVPNQSRKKDVILALGGPSSVTKSRDREIYLYRNCIGSMGVSSFMTYNSHDTQSCQQAGIAFDANGIVQQVNFIPWKK